MAANGGGDLWLWMTVGGVIVLGVAIAYATIRNRKEMTSVKARETERATEAVYDAEQRDPANRN